MQYIYHSFYPEIEDALLEAASAWNLDNPQMRGEIVFVALGFGWDPQMGRPDANDVAIFRAQRNALILFENIVSLLRVLLFQFPNGR